jgi:hypothetical protein
MTDTPSAPASTAPNPGADGGAGIPLSPTERQIVARDVGELVAAGRLTQAQADEAIKQAAGNTPAPAEASQSTPAPALAPEAVKAAQAEIDRLVSGADKEWTKAYLNAADPKHAEAVAKMTELHQAAYPEDAAAAEDAPNMGTQSAMPFEWTTADTPAHIAEANSAAHEVIAALQIDPSLARGAIQTLDRAVNQRRAIGPDGRMGAPVAMTQLELAKFEMMLQQRWGAGYDAKMDSVERAITQAGKHGAWLKRTILHAGPIAACWACDTLATQGARIAPGQSV